MKTLFQVTQPADCEGRSSHTIGLFTDGQVALRVFQSGVGNYGMGGVGDPQYYVSPVGVYESIEDFVAHHPSSVQWKAAERLLEGSARQQALAQQAAGKLSKDELEALKAVLKNHP